MKVLVYIGSHDNNSINEAFDQLDLGNEVTVVSCDKSLGICRDNNYGNKVYCKLCMCANANLWKASLAERGAKIIYLSALITKEDEQIAKDYSLSYSDVKTLKALKYKHVEIGYGAFSTYVTVTRNVMPEFTEEFKKYENFLMRREIAVTNALDRLIKQSKPDLMIFHNGRFAEFKPFLCIAQHYHIDYITTEEVYYENKVLKNNFDNAVVHDIFAKYNNYLKNWDLGKESEEERIKICKSFFEKRRKRMPAGDKVYTKDQKEGLLPEGFTREKEIISIFNSSEDEFCAVSTDYDSYKLFENQYIGLKTIFDRYKDDETKHFYLRIHPNLRNVPYPSHTKLYDLHYKNVTILSPDSPVDSYVLMDNSDKIIVFDSTMAVESAYWGKPVIELSKYMWSLMDVVYTPESEDELWELIDTTDLKCKYNDNCLKYAYWVLHPNCEEEKNIQFEDVDINLFGYKQHLPHQFLKFLGSVKLYSILTIVLTTRIARRILKPHSSFTKLPCTV